MPPKTDTLADPCSADLSAGSRRDVTDRVPTASPATTVGEVRQGSHWQELRTPVGPRTSVCT